MHHLLLTFCFIVHAASAHTAETSRAFERPHAHETLEGQAHFGEFALSREVALAEKLTLGMGGIFRINQGYVSDGHDGANHLALRVILEYALTESWAITAHSVYSWALHPSASAPGDASLIDFLHGGFGLQWSF